MPLPFPLRRGEFRLTRRHGAGVPARGPTYVSRTEPSKDSEHVMNPRQTPHPQPGLGKAIRELRLKREASLETLAGEAGITLNMLSMIERGEGNPTWATVRGIAAALGVSVSELAKAAERLEGG